MKISDPLGKVYTHTMFRKNNPNSTYDSRHSDPRYSKHKSTRSVSEEEEDTEDDEGGSIEGSEPSDDSISTKSSRVLHHQQHVRQNSARRGSRTHLSSRGEERDREDAISFASRHSRRSGAALHGSTRAPRSKTPNLRSSTLRSKRSLTNKMTTADTIGPSGTTYTLWSSQHSLKRDHRLKFNRSLCGVLLGISIVLVILGILGIIGIAVYLGVVQKLDGDGQALISVDGSIRVFSDEFNLELLRPETDAYRNKAQKYSQMISNTYRNSHLKEAFVRTVIDAFGSGSLKVFFKVIFDKNALPGPIRENPVDLIKDVFIQEAMALNGGQFDKVEIDMDTISFQRSTVQEKRDVYKPEPYQALKNPAENKTIWQNLIERPGASHTTPIYQRKTNGYSVKTSSPFRLRLDTSTPSGIYIPKQLENGQESIEISAGQSPPTSSVIVSPNLSKPSVVTAAAMDNQKIHNHLNEVFPQATLFNPHLVPSEPDPMQGKRPNIKFDAPTNPPLPHINRPQDLLTPKIANRRMDQLINSNRGKPNQQLMSAFMEPPPRKNKFGTQIMWNKSQFIPSLPMPSTPVPLKHMGQANVFSATPKIPQSGIGPNPHIPNPIPFSHQLQQQLQRRQQQPQPLHIIHTTPAQRRIDNSGPINLFNVESKTYTPDQVTASSNSFWSTIKNHKPTQPTLLPQTNTINDISNKLMWEKLQLAAAAQQSHDNLSQEKETSKPPEPRILHMSELGQIKGNIVTPSSVTIHSTGASGLNMVDAKMPSNQNMNMFKLGSSLAVSNKPEPQPIVVTSTKPIRRGEDSNIIHPDQVPTGTPLFQGPSGPVISPPTPAKFPVTQTPHAPQVSHNSNQIDKSTVNRIQSGGFHQIPGPGNYNPPLRSTPNSLDGKPGSGQMLLKSLIGQRQHQLQGNHQRLPSHLNQQAQRPQNLVPSDDRHHFQQMMKQHQPSPASNVAAINPQTLRHQGHASQNEMMNYIKNRQFASQPEPRQDIVKKGQHNLPPDKLLRRQDVVSAMIPAAAVGALSAGLTPMTIFSNLLNAYATMDSKHDITGKIVQSASNWLVGETTTAATTTTLRTTTTTATTRRRLAHARRTTTTTTTTAKTTKTTTTPTTTADLSTPFEAIVVNADDSLLPPVKSNVNPSQPLREKPPSDGSFRVTPIPYNRGLYNKYKAPTQYGVSNPYYYSKDIPQATEAYGPTDFVVETVKLDKEFLHQFFTSKPMLLGTDVVTSTSVQVKHGRKTGRESPDPDSGFNLVDRQLEQLFQNSKLAQMMKQKEESEELANRRHIINLAPIFSEVPTTQPTTTPSTTTTTSTPATTTTRLFSTLFPTTQKITRQSDIPIVINNVQKFMRYQIPPEVKVSHQYISDPQGGPRHAKMTTKPAK